MTGSQSEAGSNPWRLGGLSPSDGRDLDARLAGGGGAGRGQRAQQWAPDRPVPGSGLPVADPSRVVFSDASTYYGLPVIKAPPWGFPVAAYLVTGGAAGAAAALAAAADVLGGPDQRDLVTASRIVASCSCLASAGLLVADLGRPLRLLHMFRVVRPTSAMSVGAYVLSLTTGASLGALVLGGRPGFWGTLGSMSGVTAGVGGVPLAGYTGVLLAATAVPGWNVGVDTLPPLFMASGLATAGSLLRLAPLSPASASTVEAVTVTAQLAETVADVTHNVLVRRRPRIRAAYDAEPTHRVGQALTVASLVLGVVARRHRAAQVSAGLLGIAGSVLTKTSVFRAGLATATDPRAVPETS